MTFQAGHPGSRGWSYPNVHGGLVATADASGTKQGPTLAYDPFGQAVTTPGLSDPDGVPDNSAGNFDYGWLGQAQRPLEHAPGITTIEMGARPYVPGMGRFLGVDPVEGGSANDYDYCSGDPVNCTDVGGMATDGYSGQGSSTIVADFWGRSGIWLPLREGQHGSSPQFGAAHMRAGNHKDGYNFAKIQEAITYGVISFDPIGTNGRPRWGIRYYDLYEYRFKAGCRCESTRRQQRFLRVIVSINDYSLFDGPVGIINAYWTPWKNV